MTDKKGFDVDEQPVAKLPEGTYRDWEGCIRWSDTNYAWAGTVAEPAKEVQPAKAASVEGVSGELTINCPICTKAMHLEYGENGQDVWCHENSDAHFECESLRTPTPSQGSGEMEHLSVLELCLKHPNLSEYITQVEGELEQLKAALAEIQQLKEVQPSVQFEEWWEDRKSSGFDSEDYWSAKFAARAAWQAALAAQSGGGK